jgi:hypothetical protein
MKSQIAFINSRPVVVSTIAAAMLVDLTTSSRLQAGPVESAGAMQTESTPRWIWGLSADYMFRSVDREEDYLSGVELWNVKYGDLDGDLWGFTAFVTPPSFLNMTVDFSYRTGDLDGKFTNYSLDPNPQDPNTYTNETVTMDRDEYVLGLTLPCPALDWIYARAEWFLFDEEADWIYRGGGIEQQEYSLWGLSAGVGAQHGIPLGNSGAMLDLNAFAGLVYFDFEHEEVASGATSSWDGFGFLGRVGARVSYPIQDQLDVFLGCGYEYLQTDDGSLDMSNDGLFVNVGLKGEF